MNKKANPTLEGQLLEYLEAAPDGKSEVMWNVLQHLRARQRGETIAEPTPEGQIAEYFEAAPLEKAEALFNIVELKLAKRREQEAEAPRSGGDGPGRSRKGKREARGSERGPAGAAAPVPTPEAGGGRRSDTPAVQTMVAGRLREPVMVPVDEADQVETQPDDLEVSRGGVEDEVA